MGRRILAHNAARFSSKEEAATTLFGVGKRIFSNVDERPGFLEQAHGGILFLDEAHCLPKRVQKSLLRFAEDGLIARIGRTEPKKVDVRLILASNEPSPLFGLAKDLVQRLRVVDIPPLSRRRADIPSLFTHMLEKSLKSVDADAPPVDKLIEVEHCQSMILDGFEAGNVRELIDLADRIATRIESGADPYKAVDDIFFKRFKTGYPPRDDGETGPDPSKTGEISAIDNFPKDICKIIEAAYSWHKGNVSAIQRELHKHDLTVSRRRIAKYLDFMDLDRPKKPRG
jgi:transcriptional regulator with AAA-type ATPase domain